MTARVQSYALAGLEGVPVTVEADISKGMPSYEIVGLPDAAVKESKERVRSAVKNSGFEFPAHRVTVNLAPAYVRKEGSAFDLAIAVCLLRATGALQADAGGTVLLGELALSGELRPVQGVLPALIAAFAMGPVSGVGVCLIKNLVNLPTSYSAGIGELCNFLLGVAFVLPAGLFYKFKKDRFGALWGSLLGALIMGIASFPINYCITYPFYINAGIMSLDAILDAYQLILPSVETLPQALWIFNAPFTFFKALCDVAVTFLLYKHLSPLLKGKTL